MSLKGELTWLSMKASKMLPVPACHVSLELGRCESVPLLSDEHAEGCAGVGPSSGRKSCKSSKTLTYQGSPKSIIVSVDASYGFQLTRAYYHLQGKVSDLHIWL